MRSGLITSACLAAFFALAGCGFENSTPLVLAEDRFEDDGDLDLASEERLNKVAERRTIWPSEDVDFIRVRVNEPGVVNATDELARYWFKPAVLSGSLRFDLWDERGMNTIDYDATYNYFRAPGIYYVRYSDNGVRGGAYRHEVRFWREIDASATGWPDLVVTSLEHAGGTMVFEPGASESFTIRIANQGSANVGHSFNYQVWLNSTGQTGVGTSVRTGTFAGLSMNAMFASDAFSVASFPASPKGPVYLVAKVDSSSAVNEGPYEYNNVLIMPVVVNPDGFTGWNEDADLTLEVAGVVSVGPRRLSEDEVQLEETVRDIDELELTFDASCPQMIEVWTSGLHGGVRTTLELVDSADEVLASRTSGHAEDGSAYMAFDHTALGGTPPYRVLVSDTSGRAGAYTLNFRASDVASLGDFEPDDGPWTWRMLRANRTAVGGIPISTPGDHRRLSAEDEDWLAYGVRPEDALIVGDEGASRVHTIFVQPADHGVTLALYHHADLTTPVLTGTDSISGALLPGLYYLKVTGGPVGEAYKIRATVTPPT